MRSRSVAIAALLLLAGCAGRAVAPLVAQSLADVAKQEEERRKAIKQPAKVLTNKDLAPVPPSSQATAPVDVAGGAEPTQTSSDTAIDKDKGKDKKDQPAAAASQEEPVKDQAYWSGRSKMLQTQLDRDQTYVDALQSRINVLTTDFVNRDDPVQRALIANDRQKALDELNRLKQQIQDDQKAIADLQEDARRAGVPPGWLR